MRIFQIPGFLFPHSIFSNVFIIALLSVSVFHNHNLSAQELSPEEKKELEEKYYGSKDFKEAGMLYNQGNSHDARALFRKAFTTLEAEQNWMGIIECGSWVVNTYNGDKNFEEGLVFADSLLLKVKTEAPEYWNLCAPIYIGKIYIHIAQDNFNEALSIAYQSKVLLENNNSPEAIDYLVETYNLMSNIHSRLAHPDSAYIYTQKSYNIISEIENPPSSLLLYTAFNLGNVLHTRGNYDKALKYFEETIEHAIDFYGEENPVLGQFYILIAGCYQTLLEYERSIEYLQKALHLFEKQEGLDDVFLYSVIPSAHLSACYDYLQLHQLEEAIYHYERAAEYEKNDVVEMDSNAYMLRLWGQILMEQKKPAEAIVFFKQAKAVNTEFNKRSNNENPAFNEELIKNNTDVASAHQQMGQLDSAIIAFKEAIRINEKDPERTLEESKPYLYHRLADIYIGRGQLDSASWYNQIALQNICHSLQDANNVDLPAVDNLKNIPDAYTVLLQKARIFHQLADISNTKEKQLSLLRKGLDFMVLSDELHVESLKKANLRRTAKSTTLIDISIVNYKEGITLANKAFLIAKDQSDLDQAFYFAQKMKAQQLWMSILDSKAKNFINLDKELLDTERDLIEEITYYEKKLREAIAENDSTSIDIYRNDHLFGKKELLSKLYRQIEAENPSYYESKYTFVPEDETSLKEILKEDEVLLEYVMTDSLLFTFVIAKDQRLQLYTTPLNEDFADKVTQLNQMLQNSAMLRKSSRLRFIELSYEIYQVLIQPVSANIKDKNRLIIIGDGLTNYIPFEALISSNDLNTFDRLDYLVKKHEVSYHYSATLFAKARNKQMTENSGLLAFAPVYDELESITAFNQEIDSYRAFNEDGTFIPLPESEKEVNNIARIFQQKNKETTILLRQKASEKTLKEQLEEPFQYIHLAGHSFADLESPDFSGVVCYQDSTLKAEDGILYSGEIFGLQTNADLITLSSCESGYGKLQGTEGLLGLNRAFIYAGAQNVTYSLWKVYDKVSASLMVDFYEGILEGKTYATSLRKAKLDLLENPATASPHYWSAYLLIGR